MRKNVNLYFDKSVLVYVLLYISYKHLLKKRRKKEKTEQRKKEKKKYIIKKEEDKREGGVHKNLTGEVPFWLNLCFCYRHVLV